MAETINQIKKRLKLLTAEEIEREAEEFRRKFAEIQDNPRYTLKTLMIFCKQEGKDFEKELEIARTWFKNDPLFGEE